MSDNESAFGDFENDFEDFEELCESYGLEVIKEKKQERKSKARAKTYVSGHLASPSYGEEVDMLTDGEMTSCTRHRILTPIAKKCKSFRSLKDPISVLEDWISKDEVSFDTLNERKAVMLSCSQNLVLQMLSHTNAASGLVSKAALQAKLEDVLRDLSIRIYELDSDLKNSIRAEKMKDAVCYKEVELGKFTEYRQGKFERDISIVPLKDGDYLFPTTLMLMALDKVQAYFWLRLYWLLCDILNSYPGQSILERGSNLITIFKELRQWKSVGFFNFVSSWEALVVGYVVKQPDDLGCTELFDHQSAEMSEYLIGNKRYRIEDLLPKTNRQNEIRMYLELTGIVKALGYPTLSSRNLLDQLKEHGTAILDWNMDVVQGVVAIARRDIFLQYRKKRGKYPMLKYCPQRLIEFYESGKIPPAAMYKDYEMWSQIIFDKNAEFDYSPDLSEIIKDSACAPNQNAWGSQFDACAFKYHYNKPPPPSASKDIPTGKLRTIDGYLTADEDLVRKLIGHLERGQYDRLNHIIFQCGKELEQKEVSGRAFTKQTFFQRLIQTSLEMNVAKNIFPYVPEQSMTDSEIAIANKHMAHHKSMLGESELINLDLTKWCLRWRQVVLFLFKKIYDEWFGLNGVYMNSHDFFHCCPMFCNNRFSPPDYDMNGDPIPGDFYFNSFKGGCEGMHQKPWTHFTSALVKYVLERLNLKGTIMCQGDNIIVILHFTKDQLPHRDRLRKEFLSLLDTTLQEVGHKLKRKETWYSKHLHEYGKQRVYKGVAISLGTKKSTKIIPDINDGLFSLQSSISTINTITEAIARGSPTPTIAFIINQMCVGNYLARKDLIPQRHKDKQGSDYRLKARLALLFPTDFGGIPLSTYSSHAVRGHPDSVTTWLGILLEARKSMSFLYDSMIAVWKMAPNSPASNYQERSRFIRDPFSLRVDSLPSAENNIKDLTMKYLKTSGCVTNPILKRLFDADYSYESDLVCKVVDTMQPYYPQFAHTLAKESNAWIGEGLQAKLTASKTIENATKVVNDESLIQIISRNNADFTVQLKQRLTGYNTDYNRYLIGDETCSYRLAEKLRVHSWGRTDIVNLTKPHHSHQYVMVSMDDVTEDDRSRSILIKTSDEFQSDELGFSSKFGPFKPYIGSITDEKITRASVDLVEKTSYAKSMKNLGKQMSWAKLIGSEDIYNFTRYLISEKLDVVDIADDEEAIKLISDQVRSGNIFHRLASSVEPSSSMLNGSLTGTSHFFQSSNLMQGMTKSGEDHSIFFQYSYASNMSVLMCLRDLDFKFPPEIAAVLRCTDCTHLLPSVNFVMPGVSMMQSKSPIAIQTKSRIEPKLIDAPHIHRMHCINLGMMMASTIDDNYIVHHQSGNIASGTEIIKKACISINDLKRCDFKLVLVSTLFFSRHCQEISRERDEFMARMTNDLSFEHLAEVIIDADLRTHLFAEMGKQNVNEHTMVTTYSRMSAFIGRSCKDYMTATWRYARDEILPYSFKPDGLYGGLTPEEVRLMYGVGHFAFQDNSIAQGRLRDAVTKRNASRAKAIFGVEHIFVPYSKENTTSLWRNNPPAPRKVELTPAYSTINFGTDYPHGDTYSYHSIRNREGLGDIECNYLAFKARPCVMISSAGNKYLECLSALGYIGYLTMLNDRFMGYCLAEGSGGWFTTMMLQFPNGRGAYQTWLSASIDKRDCATDGAAPASQVASISVSRQPFFNKLPFGVTNILDDKFSEKLAGCFSEHCPSLVTMDAESKNHGTNMEFVEKLFPIILQDDDCIVIFKMFMSPFLYEAVTRYMSRYNRPWVFIKPISSNPQSTEIFLCVMRKCDIVSDKVKSAEEQVVRYLSSVTDDGRPSLGMTVESIDAYDYAATSIYRHLIALGNDDNRSLGDRPIALGACGMICYINLHGLLRIMDRIHTHDGDETVHTLVRAGGTNHVLYDMYLSVFFVVYCLANPHRRLSDLVLDLSMFDCDETRIPYFRTWFSKSGWKVDDMEEPKPIVFRRVMAWSFIKGGYTSKFNDIKFMMRDMNRHVACNCPTAEMPPIGSTSKCLSWSVLCQIQQFGINSKGNQKIKDFYYRD